MESRLQNGTFIYKVGFLVTKCVFRLRNGILALQTGIPDYNSSVSYNYNIDLYKIKGILSTIFNNFPSNLDFFNFLNPKDLVVHFAS